MTAEEPREPRSSRAWPFVIGLIALVAILVGSLLYVFRVVADAPAGVVREGRAALGELQRVAQAFRTGTVTTTFISYATEVSGFRRLQFATLRQTELFERTDEATVLWGQLELPDLVVEARAPVEYTYYLDLDGRWEFREENGRIRVIAPEIQYNEPAVDASGIEYVVRTGSFLRDPDRALERLKRGITTVARRRAHENIPLVRELGRRETEEFVASWLAAGFADGADYSVEVTFRDEADAVRAPRPGDTPGRDWRSRP